MLMHSPLALMCRYMTICSKCSAMVCAQSSGFVQPCALHLVGPMGQISLNQTKSKFQHLHFAQAALLVIVFCFLSVENKLYAASQGKLGLHSSASVDISVTVNQTLKTIAPTELFITSGRADSQDSSKPFCVKHLGNRQSAGLPYNLIVDDIKQFDKNGVTDPASTKAFNLLLLNKHLSTNKIKLTPGMTFSSQSKSSLNQDLVNKCSNSSLEIAVEKNGNTQNLKNVNYASGLLLLLVSPN